METDGLAAHTHPPGTVPGLSASGTRLAASAGVRLALAMIGLMPQGLVPQAPAPRSAVQDRPEQDSPAYGRPAPRQESRA